MQQDQHPVARNTTGAMSVEQSRAIEEVQAAMVIAQRFPRNEEACTDKILKACTRPKLAEQALYAFRRGGQMVSGPSIRLAEAMAQNWGNLQAGVRELSNDGGESIVETFAWDLETNWRESKVFTVPHVRYKKDGSITRLVDPRDIYEHIANQGARRKRACILAVIPGDVVESAVHQCQLTQETSIGETAEAAAKMVEAFRAFDITEDMIIARMGHNLAATLPAEIVQLRQIFVSLRDGMSHPGDWFDVPLPDQDDSGKVATNIKDKLANGDKPTEPEPAAPAGDTPDADAGGAAEEIDEEQAEADLIAATEAKAPPVHTIPSLIKQAEAAPDAEQLDIVRSLRDEHLQGQEKTLVTKAINKRLAELQK